MSDDNSGHTVGHYPSERVITPVFTYADGRMGPAPDQIIVPGSSIFVTAATFCYLALVQQKVPSEGSKSQRRPLLGPSPGFSVLVTAFTFKLKESAHCLSLMTFVSMS